MISLVIPHMPSMVTDAALDRCLESFRGQYDELILIVNNGMGYGPAVNLGLKYSTGDYIVVTNNDVLLLNGELETLTYWDGFVIPTITPEPKDYKPRSIFCMSRTIYEKILERDGFFYDPRFETGYFEDDDLHERTKDIKCIQAEPVIAEHTRGGGMTMKQMGEKRWFDINEKVFKEKWNICS
jgi:glycosyltransferase involved in cell wall biosynthesis